VVFGLLLAVLAWFFLSGDDDAPEPTAHRRSDETIDHTALEQAERDVRDARDEDSIRDWGPGASRPPLA